MEKLFTETDAYIKGGIRKSLAGLYEHSLPSMVEILMDDTEEWSRREEMMNILGLISWAARPPISGSGIAPLLTLFEHESAYFRNVGIMTLAQISGSAIPLVIGLIDDPNLLIQDSVFKVLVRRLAAERFLPLVGQKHLSIANLFFC